MKRRRRRRRRRRRKPIGKMSSRPDLQSSRCHFHQRFTYSVFAHGSWKCAKIQLSHQYLFTLSGSVRVKAVHRTLMKLSPGVNVINVLRATFGPVDPKSVKRYWQLDWILTLFWATCVEAENKYVGEIEPRSINILHAAFMCVDPKSAKSAVKPIVFFCTFGICAHKSRH
jgi:hypothetical protein